MKIYQAKVKWELLVNEGRAVSMDGPEAVVTQMRGAFDEYPEQESFWVLILNRKNFCKGRHMITLGTQNGTLVHPREVFRLAVMEGAAAIIVCHNHPSGDPAPSSADIRVTRQLREAGEILGIALLDHIILGDPEYTKASNDLGFYSFSDSGLL